MCKTCITSEVEVTTTWYLHCSDRERHSDQRLINKYTVKPSSVSVFHIIGCYTAIDSCIREVSRANSETHSWKTHLMVSTLSMNTNTLNTTLTPAGLEHMIRINRSTEVNIAECHSSQRDHGFWWRGGEFPALNQELKQQNRLLCFQRALSWCCWTDPEILHEPAKSMKAIHVCT